MTGRDMNALPVLIAALLLAAMAGCATPVPPVPDEPHGEARFEPAPMPSVGAPRRSGFVVGLPPKMPPGTGAVPVSGGPVRGSVTTGIRTSF